MIFKQNIIVPRKPGIYLSGGESGWAEMDLREVQK